MRSLGCTAHEVLGPHEQCSAGLAWQIDARGAVRRETACEVDSRLIANSLLFFRLDFFMAFYFWKRLSEPSRIPACKLLHKSSWTQPTHPCSPEQHKQPPKQGRKQNSVHLFPRLLPHPFLFSSFILLSFSRTLHPLYF